MYAVAEHRNYQPVVHKRAAALVDKHFLVILDLLEQTEEDPVYRSIFILIHQQWLPIPQNPVSARLG